MFHRSIALASALFAATAALAQTDVPFALDWKFEGPAALARSPSALPTLTA